MILSMKNKTSLTIDIPVPCTQSWENMSPMDKGRYCGHCSKKIIDFTKLADHEVARIFLDSKGAVCGRFNENQLNRDLLYIERDRANAIVPALLVSTALAAGIASNAVANRQITDIRQTEQSDTTGVPVPVEVSNKDKSDTTGMPAVDDPVQMSPDSLARLRQREVIVSTLTLKREPVTFVGFTVSSLPATKRGMRKARKRYHRAFSKALRSKSAHIKTASGDGAEK